VLAARESLHGRPTALHAEARFRQHSQQGARAAARARWWSQINQNLTPVLVSFTSVAMLVAGVYQVEAQALSVGGLISVNMLGIRLLTSLCSMAPVFGRWQEFARALGQLGETVDLQAAPLTDTQALTSAFCTEGLRLEGASFQYPQARQPLLSGLTLQLKPNTVVALVGASGAGKSTLLRLLAGQLPHTDGRLVFGAHVVADDASRHWLGRQVHHKPQDPCFLGGRLGDIVAAGASDATDESLVAALRSAGLGPALDHGDLGLNTVVGTNGLGLSGGQRQMVALAAAFHGRQPVLLLDEPTLGLDRAAQERVIEALPGLREGRCILIATHAAELIQKADRILVLDRGRLVADGTPDRLMGAA
jgi:ABC-type bacteriocin/lantibiotic exporter with double-glycine peptidase domain